MIKMKYELTKQRRFHDNNKITEERIFQSFSEMIRLVMKLICKGYF